MKTTIDNERTSRYNGTISNGVKKLLIAAIVALGMFTAIRWSQAMDHGSGEGHSGALTPDEEAYQKAMDAARKFNGENKAKEAEDAVNKALMYKPNDPAALALKARITKKVKGMTYTGTNEQGQQEYKHNKTGIIFVLIPGGTLVIEEPDNSAAGDGSGGGGDGSGAEDGSGNGGDDGSNDRDKNKRRELKVDDFLMSKYETPQGVWINFMNDNPAWFKKGNDYPVEQVNWNDSQSFCKKTDLRLPSWVEWEYSCRAGSTTAYFWGKEPNDDYLWYNKNSAAATHPVATRKGNGFGLYNMPGNVMEWCNDLYKYMGPDKDKDKDKENNKDKEKDKDKGKANGNEPGNNEKYGMLRGGAWDQQIELCQSASYIQALPTAKNKNAGFRCARDINKP